MENIKLIWNITHVRVIFYNVFSPACGHRCPESSQETGAPRRCWSRCRSNLCTAPPAVKAGSGHISCAQLSVYVYVHTVCPQFFCFVFVQFPLSMCGRALRASTLPFSGRTIDWEWLSGCLASCCGPELRDWASALLNAIVLRVSEEAASCMLFTGVKGQGQMFGSVVKDGTNKQGKGKSIIYCVLPIVIYIR